MARSVWKGKGFYGKAITNTIWKRGQRVLHQDVGKFYKIHNGKRFVEVLVEDIMVGRCFGEYAITRHMGVDTHVKKRKKKGTR